jgi:hypothetical protein
VRRVEQAAALAGYAGVSFAYFGWRLLPHPGRVVLGDQNAPIYIWSFGWWRHAIGELSNPLVTHSLYAGAGLDIAWTPSAPGLGLVFSPFTALVGPVAAFNVVEALLPALAAWTAYLLCRYLTGSTWASLIGGYLFGFSAANLRQVSPGNINLSAVFLFPLVALVLVRYLRSDLTRRGLVGRLGVLLAFQLTISTEFAAMVTLALVICLPLAYWLARDLRPRLRSALGPVIAAYALAAVIASPFVYYLLFHFDSSTVVTDIKLWGTDLLGAFVPSFVIGIGGNDLASLQQRVKSHSAYLGLPTIAIVALYAIRSRRAAGTRFLVAAFACAVVATLGATLMIYGHTLFALPWWNLATHLPALNDMLPFRFAILEELAAAVIVALWTARTTGRIFPRPFVLPVLAAAAIVPAVWTPSAFTPLHLEHESFFTSGLFGRCIAPNETVAVFPYTTTSLILQAETGFRFKLAQGGLQLPGNRFAADPILSDLETPGIIRPTVDRLLAFAGAHGVDRVVSIAADGYPTGGQMKRFGATSRLGGVIVAPGCGKPPLATRDLSRFVEEWERHPPPPRVIGWCLSGTFTNIHVGFAPPPTPANKVAFYVQGAGLTCSPPPAGYARHGLAPAALGVRGGTYPYFTPLATVPP